jgi:hypothetical protein
MILPELRQNDRPRNIGGRREGRVPTAPMVRVQKKRTRQNHRYEPNIRPPLRDGCRGLYVISPGTGLIAPVSCNAHHEHRELDLSTGRPGPHDFAVRMTSFVRAQAHCDIIRPSHPASHVRDDRDTPLLRGSRTATIHAGDLPDKASRFFFSEGLDRFFQRSPGGQIGGSLAATKGRRLIRVSPLGSASYHCQQRRRSVRSRSRHFIGNSEASAALTVDPAEWKRLACSRLIP